MARSRHEASILKVAARARQGGPRSRRQWAAVGLTLLWGMGWMAGPAAAAPSGERGG